MDREGSSSTASVWMDAAFTLDELHLDLDVCPMDADMEALDQQQPSPTAMHGFDTLSAFLSEMNQLDEATAGTSSTTTCIHRETEVKTNSLAASVSVSCACDTQGTKTKTTKLTSTQRARRDKLELQATIARLQQEFARISAAHQEQFAHIVERWNPVIRQEQRQLKRVLALRHRLHQLLAIQWTKASQVHDLIRQWTDLMLFCPSVQIDRTLQTDDSRDAAIFIVLERNVKLKYQLQHEQMLLTDDSVAAREFQGSHLSSDSQTMGLYYSRLVPFEVAQIADVAWQWGEREFADSRFKPTSSSLNTHMLKQELVITPPNSDAMKLTLRAVCKRFLSDNYTTLRWEGTCDWSPLHDGSSCRTTTQESGWVVFRPIEISPPVSQVQAFARATPSDASEPWMQLMQTRSVLAKVILPSSEQAMLERHQSVENQLVDASLREN